MEDLSHMLSPRTGLTAGESMAGGNTMSRPDSAMSAPGSEPVNPLPAMAEMDDPSLDLSGMQDFRPLVNSHGSKAGD